MADSAAIAVGIYACMYAYKYLIEEQKEQAHAYNHAQTGRGSVIILIHIYKSICYLCTSTNWEIFAQTCTYIHKTLKSSCIV